MAGEESNGVEETGAERQDMTNEEIIEQLRAELAVAKHNERMAFKEIGGWARQAGLAKGRLEASKLAGIVDDWRERALAAEAKLEKLKGE